jgi:hypothetical protein
MQFMSYFNPFNDGMDRYYCHHTLYLQTRLTELQSRMSENPSQKHITVVGVNTGYIHPEIWNRVVRPKVPLLERFLDRILDRVPLNKIVQRPEINAQQASLAITNAATTKVGITQAGRDAGVRYFNRIWPAEPMPQTKDADYRQEMWNFVQGALCLDLRLTLFGKHYFC